MKQGGFTLVELMTVIVIVAVLAAVALPKFFDSANKAKMTEVPVCLKAMMSSQEIYRGENSAYADCPWLDANGDNANDNMKNLLGLTLAGEFFQYATEIAGSSYTVSATVGKSFGGLTVGISKLTATENLVFSFNDAADEARFKRFSAFVR